MRSIAPSLPWLVLLRARAQSHALVVARSFGLAVFDNKLYAVGGTGGGGYLDSVETLSMAGGTWNPEANGLNTARDKCVGRSRSPTAV